MKGRGARETLSFGAARSRPGRQGPAGHSRAGGVAAREGARGERAGPLRQNRAPRARVMFAGARHGPAASMGVREPLQP